MAYSQSLPRSASPAALARRALHPGLRRPGGPHAPEPGCRSVGAVRLPGGAEGARSRPPPPASACRSGRPLARRWVRCTRGAAAVQRFMQRRRRRRLLLLPPRKQTDRALPSPPSRSSMPPPPPPPPLRRRAGGSGPGWAALLAAPLPSLPSAGAREPARAPAAS